MRLLIAGLTAFFVLLGTFGFAGGVAGLFTTGTSTFLELLPQTTWIGPDPVSLGISLVVIAYSVLLIGAAAFFAKTCWPEAGPTE